MTPGSLEQARALAVERWQTFYNFDLEPSSWDSIFEQFHPCDVLQAIKELKLTRSKVPSVIYERFCIVLERLAAGRAA
jgi:hypothetical protein